MSTLIQTKPQESRKLGFLRLNARAISSRLLVRRIGGPDAVERSSLPGPQARTPRLNALKALRAYISSRTRTPSSFERLPVEILEQIVMYACTDGGWTASALARVSRDIREISTVGRFFSVSLSSGSLCRLQTFLAKFKEARAAAPGASATKLRHLCIAISPPWLHEPGYGPCFHPPGEQCVEHTIVPNDDRPEPQSWVPGGHAAWESRVKADYRAAVEELLDLVADELETLYFHDKQLPRDSEPPVVTFSRPFSKLRELSFTRSLPTFCRSDEKNLNDAPVMGPLFPELRRWHIITDASDLTRPFSFWVSNSPKLAQMQFTLPSGPFSKPPHPKPFVINFVELAKQYNEAVQARTRRRAQRDGSGHHSAEITAELVLLSIGPDKLTDQDVHDEGVRDLHDRIATIGISPNMVVHVDPNYRMKGKYDLLDVTRFMWLEWQARCRV